MSQQHLESLTRSARHSNIHVATPLHPKTVTVFLDASLSGNKRATHAIALAQSWDAHVIGVYVVPDGAMPDPASCYALGEKAIDQVIALGRRLQADAEAAAAQVGDRFNALCRRMNVGGEFRLLRDGRAEEEAILNSLHSDLVVVGHPRPHGLPEGMAQERILLDSGAPLLVVPNDWHGGTIGDNILIAWNASREARRAVSDAMSLLTAAKSVTVLVIDAAGRRSHGEEPGADLAVQLARHGVHVEVVRLTSSGAPVAELILEHAAKSGADLLVFGAYSHARARELLLGGATRTLLARMPVPVFVSR